MKKTLKKLFDLIPFKKYLFFLIRPFHIPQKFYKHLYFKDEFTVKVENTNFLIKHYGFQIENELFWCGLTKGWEKISMRLWIELCKSAEVIVDIGANTGIYSLVAKSINQKSKVFGFEPVHRVFEKFLLNCKLNNFDIHCLPYAASNYNGEAIIYDVPSEHVYSVTVNKNIAKPGIKTIETKIQTQKLSTFIKNFELTKIDLIKIDVETHEPEVLEGMEEFLMQFQPTLLIEILNNEVGNKVQSILKDIDYLFFNIDEKNTPAQVKTIVKSNYFNYLICKREVALSLGLIN